MPILTFKYEIFNIYIIIFYTIGYKPQFNGGFYRTEPLKCNTNREDLFICYTGTSLTMAERMDLERRSSIFDPIKGLLLTYFMPESCYDEFFLNFNFLDGKFHELDKFSCA